MSLTHLPDSQIRNLTVLENLTLNNDLVFSNKLIVNDTTDGNNTTGSIKTAGGISSAKNVYANSFSMLDLFSQNVSLTKGTGSPNSAYIKFGDGTGWNFIFKSNPGSNLMTITDNGDVNINRFTTLGSNVTIKVKKLTGTFSSSPNSSVNIAHGLDWTKIISCNVHVKTTSGGIQPIIPPNFTISANLEFQYQITDTNVVVFSNSSSSNLYGCPITITVLYSK